MSEANSSDRSVFGKVRMGYVLVESQRIDQWQQFAGDALGMHVERVAGVLVCRLDDHARRIVVVDGVEEDVAALGYQLDDEAALQEVLGRLRARSVAVREGAAAEAALRGVQHFWQFKGPKGINIELFVEPLLAQRPLKMLASGFGTGAGGMGHVAITSRRPGDALAFWQQIFDARVSDRIEDRVSGMTLDITFLRLNPRHHSVAIAATRGVKMDPMRTRIHHLNIQPVTLDDLGAAYGRCRKLGFRMALGVGQHPNDKEISFYAVSPSGFYLEYGWAPIEVDEASWEMTLHKGISVWGHSPKGLTLRDKLGELVSGVRSLARAEYAPF
ncbi:MAG: VOC family protein [Halieaceae bacterium]|nr:VOC family protein [Halieaceae bacterium]